MSLGQIIRKRRQELRFTLDEVAARTGFSKPYLSTVETGKVNNPPSDNCLRKLEVVMEFEKGLLLHIAHIESMPPDRRMTDFIANHRGRPGSALCAVPSHAPPLSIPSAEIRQYI